MTIDQKVLEIVANIYSESEDTGSLETAREALEAYEAYKTNAESLQTRMDKAEEGTIVSGLGRDYVKRADGWHLFNGKGRKEGSTAFQPSDFDSNYYSFGRGRLV